MLLKMFKWILRKIEFRRKNIKIWKCANVYPSAKIGRNVSIGAFTEIGHNVEIGENTRIGAGCFIPEGVTIGRNCFIGPHTVFSNDRYPMSPRECWEQTTVEDYVSIGAGVNILPGIRIKKFSLVGMGTVLVRNVPEYEIIAGNPGRSIRNTIDKKHGTIKS